MTDLAAGLRGRLERGDGVAIIEVVETKGSTPREPGAVMLVTADAIAGTIGGGTLEWRAMARARELLATGQASATLSLPLGPETGQCCGGHVRLSIRLAVREDVALLRRRQPAAMPVLLFGAGHVGRAIAQALGPLPLNLRWIDERADAFALESSGVVAANPLCEVVAAPPGATFLVLTHSHARDFELCEAVLRRGDAAYLGLIGSRTKRARFVHGLQALDLDTTRLTCPIGSATICDKRPEVIAALVAAELIAVMHEMTVHDA